MGLAQVLFSLSGRIDRLTFWVIIPALLLIGLSVDGAIEELIAYDDRTDAAPLWFWLLTTVALISLVWIYFATLTKRLHDRDKSAKWLLLSLVPVIGFVWVVIELGCLRGTEGPNRYGSGGSAQS